MIAALSLPLLLLASPPSIRQVGSLENLMTGRYDGEWQVGQVLGANALGLGTYNGLDGEGIALDGVAYHANAFGEVNAMPPTARTPFFFAVPYREEWRLEVKPETHLPRLQAMLDRQYPGDGALAIRLEGTFRGLVTRAFPPQMPPYLPFPKIGDRQAFASYPGEIQGTFVGFRLPKSVGKANVPGYHFHFLDDARQRGGHVVRVDSFSGTVGVMRTGRITLSN